MKIPESDSKRILLVEDETVMSGRELYQWLKDEHLQQISKVVFTSGSMLG